MRQRRISEFLPNTRDYYLVDENGNIFNERIQRYAKQRYRAGTKYHIINLKQKDGTSKGYRVHRLVAMAFLEKKNENQNEVNHIDGNKENNSVSNLEWCTPSENQQHAFRTGLQSSRKGEKSNFSKLTSQDIEIVFQMRQKGATQNEIAKAVGCTRSNISYILKGKTWQV